MKRIFCSKNNCLMAIDGEYEFELGFCGKQIKLWKSLYFKKNSTIETKIQVRCCHSAPDPMFWTYFLELSRKGKIEIKFRICNEAYDVLINGKTPESYTGVEFVTLEHFIKQKS